MNTQRQWDIARVQLDSLRRNIPPWIDEERVGEYHAILDLLQEASGEGFILFRIPQAELKPKVTCWTMGTRRAPGHVTYSEKRYCDDDFFVRKVEAAWEFVLALDTPEESTCTDIRPRGQNSDPPHSNITVVHSMQNCIIQQGTERSHASLNSEGRSMVTRCWQSIRSIFENAVGGLIAFLMSKMAGD